MASLSNCSGEKAERLSQPLSRALDLAKDPRHVRAINNEDQLPPVLEFCKRLSETIAECQRSIMLQRLSPPRFNKDT